MSKDTRRAHVLIPEDLLREVDELVGPRKRSEFFVDAVREKVRRERARKLAHELAGSLKENHLPDWDTPESASACVHDLRRESDERAFSPDEQS